MIDGDTLYLLANKGHPRGRILKASVSAPAVAGAEEVLAQGSAVIETIGRARDGLYLRMMDGGIAGLKRLGLAGAATSVLDIDEFPPAVGQGAIGIETRDNDAVTRGDGRGLFSFSSDAEPDELCCEVDLTTSEDAVVASLAWRSSSVPDIDDGRRLVIVGDLTPGRPSVDDVDVTRV